MKSEEHASPAPHPPSAPVQPKQDTNQGAYGSQSPMYNAPGQGMREQTAYEEPVDQKGDHVSKSAMVLALTVLLPVAGGVFAAMSVSQSSIANDQSQVANQIALLSMCYANSVRLIRIYVLIRD